MKKVIHIISLILFCVESYSQTTQTITTAGAGTFTVPCGVTSITVQCWGGGGAGGGTNANISLGGGGGAGGTYASSVFTVLPNTTFSYNVGAQSVTSSGTVVNGNPSWFGNTSTLFAQGGAGGAVPNGGIVSGGTGSSTSSIGTILISGGNGANGNSTTGGAGGNGANSGGTGGVQVTTENDGNDGNVPGGGGGGAFLPDNSNHIGGRGARGEIRITYATPPAANAGIDQTPSCTTTATLAANSVPGYTGLWTCNTNCGSININNPSSPTSQITGLTEGTSVSLQWTLTYSTGCTLPPAVVTINPIPCNDDPSGATPITPGATCNYTTFTNAFATATTCGTITAPGCGGYSGGDVWFSVTVPASGSFTLNSQSGVMTDGAMAVYSGSPCGLLTLISCDDNSGAGNMPLINVSGQTPGATLYVRFWEDGNNNNGTFGICCSANVPPLNDNCTGAYNVVANSGAACTSQTSGSVLNATASSFTNTCGGSADDDVWFGFVATSNTHSVSLNNINGSTTDLYHSVYAGTCGSPGTPIVCSDPNSSSLTGLTIGSTYFIRVYTRTATIGQNTSFSVCVTTPPVLGPCGNVANNDYCSNPAVLTTGASTFSSTTSSIYTVDEPGNVDNIFCGQIDNNSWYYFVATASTAAFPISSVTGCSSGGIQAQIYAVSQSSLGCCTSFTSVSNCFNPGNVSTGTVTATGLNIGQTYILMVDGWAGAVCNFVFSGWSSIGILPINLIDFSGKNEGKTNRIDWTSATENNSDYYILEKSNNGITFNNLIKINAAGNSLAPLHYQTIDLEPYPDITYYRLKKVDLDGTFEYSNIIAINNMNLTDYISDIIPNPTNDFIRFDVNTLTKNTITAEITDNLGKILITENFKIEDGGYSSINLNLSDLNSGMYYLKVVFKNSSKIEIKKIIKN